MKASVFPSGENCGVLSTSCVVVTGSSCELATVTMYASRRSSRTIGDGDASNASRVPSGDQDGVPRTVYSPLVTLDARLFATSTTHTWLSRKSAS